MDIKEDNSSRVDSKSSEITLLEVNRVLFGIILSEDTDIIDDIGDVKFKFYSKKWLEEELIPAIQTFKAKNKLQDTTIELKTPKIQLKRLNWKNCAFGKDSQNLCRILNFSANNQLVKNIRWSDSYPVLRDEFCGYV